MSSKSFEILSNQITFPESQGGCKSSDASLSSSQVNPFSRQGGTILLSAPPAPGPSQQQACSSLGLQLSQGYTQMFGGRLTPTNLSYILVLH